MAHTVAAPRRTQVVSCDADTRCSDACPQLDSPVAEREQARPSSPYLLKSCPGAHPATGPLTQDRSTNQPAGIRVPRTGRFRPAREPLLVLFVQAVAALLVYDVLALTSSFGKIHRMVKGWKVIQRENQSEVIDRVCKAVNYACVWYPKQALCLQRSIVTTYLLRKRGVAAQMVLGAQQVPFKAHAWTEVEGRAINERNDVQNIYAIWDRC